MITTSKCAVCAAVAFLLVTAGSPAAQAPSNAQGNSSPQAAGPPVKVQTKLITVDVVVNDSHGNPVRGLKQENFQIFEEHNQEQKIVRFAFVDRAASAAASAAAPAPAGAPAGAVFSNAFSTEKTIPPTILLMDALNTDIQNQVEVHRHMLMLLKTLPPNTPVAVFTLGHALHVVQSFTTDPKILQAAVDHSLRGLSQEQNPQDDPNSLSNINRSNNNGQETGQNLVLEDMENEVFESQTSLRIDETVEAMQEIAKYLSGYPGRKNLIWFSEAFPTWLEPQADSGTDPFMGATSFEDKIKKASQALTDAQVAIYPVDARGLAVPQIYTADQSPRINSNRNPGGQMATQIRRQSNAVLDSQAAMEEVAEATGGRTCKNTNDLSGCVQSAINDGAVYYELAYYPEGVPWDGHFHKITVKTDEHGVKLDYRRGYFATDVAPNAGKQPEQILEDDCMEPLPSTAIPITVESVAPGPAAGSAASPRYLMTVSPAPLTFTPANNVRLLSLQMAICEFNPKADHFEFFPHNLSSSVPEAAYPSIEKNGVRDVFDYAAKPEDTRLRFVVLDVPSGVVGSVDVPAHPTEFASLPPGVAPAPPASPVPPAAPQPRMVTTSLTFKAGERVSHLDWTNGTVSYQGDLGVDLGASGFFQKFFGNYHCQAGTLVGNDPAAPPPKLGVLLETPHGLSVVVDLTGAEPQYTGTLPVDDSGKDFFSQVWKLCHCQDQ
ncbi:MAG TPA: VWA domain-containing protein [Candidatus Aquilonibacter sp.]|nr:VWA domain-containing protein [Candidatus Aquilonibacter sp.]